MSQLIYTPFNRNGDQYVEGQVGGGGRERELRAVAVICLGEHTTPPPPFKKKKKKKKKKSPE